MSLCHILSYYFTPRVSRRHTTTHSHTGLSNVSTAACLLTTMGQKKLLRRLLVGFQRTFSAKDRRLWTRVVENVCFWMETLLKNKPVVHRSSLSYFCSFRVRVRVRLWSFWMPLPYENYLLNSRVRCLTFVTYPVLNFVDVSVLLSILCSLCSQSRHSDLGYLLKFFSSETTTNNDLTFTA